MSKLPLTLDLVDSSTCFLRYDSPTGLNYAVSARILIGKGVGRLTKFLIVLKTDVLRQATIQFGVRTPNGFVEGK